jgi:hypothetical protein
MVCHLHSVFDIWSFLLASSNNCSPVPRLRVPGLYQLIPLQTPLDSYWQAQIQIFFGRRLFLLFGNACCCVGFIVTATSMGADHFTAGLAMTGFGAGFAQMAMCSIPNNISTREVVTYD